MRVLVLTNPEYFEFVWSTVSQYQEHEGLVWDTKIERFEKYTDKYDIGISFMYQHKVPAKEVNSHPWFNFHPAPLPEYKGRDLCYHAIMNGEKEFGATIHYMDENFDTGDIIGIVTFDIEDGWTAEDLSREAIETSKDLFQIYFPLILKTPVFSRTPNRGGTYYKKGHIEDTIPLHDVPLARWIRAVTYKNFYPTIVIGGVKYKIVREE